jgi:hypothetical protein
MSKSVWTKQSTILHYIKELKSIKHCGLTR